MADADFNVDQYRSSHDSNTEWDMRRRFLLEHHDKFSIDRLLCLASCYISVECYGNRYPAPVMRQLQELTRYFPETPVSIIKRNQVKFVKSSEKTGRAEQTFDVPSIKQDQMESAIHSKPAKSIFDSPFMENAIHSKPAKSMFESPFMKNQVKFVKASSSTESTSDSIPVLTSNETSTIFDTPQTTSVFQELSSAQPHLLSNELAPKKSPGLMFVKSSDKYHSTDIAHPGSTSDSHVAVVHNVNQCQVSGSKKGLGFSGKKGGGSAVDIMKSQSEPNDELFKFHALSKQLRDLSVKRRNAIETLHMAVDKIKMLVSPVFDSGPAGQFVCVLKIDFIIVAKGNATSKKAAKHNSYEKAVEQLQRQYLRINEDDPENKILECSDERFEVGTVHAESTDDEDEMETEKSNNRKRPAPGTDAALSQFLIIEPQRKAEGFTSASVLRQSSAINKYDFELDFADHGNQIRVTVHLGGCLIADVLAMNKTEGKTLACATALDYLRTICWTIQTKQHKDTDEASIDRDEMLGNIQAEMRNAKISDSNIGNKLLKKMGWVGGGLGKEGNEGITEPITADQVINREGLGLQAEQGISRDFLPRMKQLVQEYARSNKQKDLVFAPLFSKEERALIHKEAQKLGLKTHSHSSGENRYLVVSRKRTPGQLFSHIMDSGGETSKYVLIPPNQDHDK